MNAPASSLSASQAAIRRLRLSYLFGLASFAALALISFLLIVSAVSDQEAVERRAVAALGEAAAKAPTLQAEAAALADAAEENRGRRQRYLFLQAGIFAITFVVLLIGLVRIVPARVRQIRADVQKLEETQSRWRTIYASISDGLLILEPDGRIVAMNPSAEAMLGYRTDEVKGRSLQILLPEPERSHFDAVRPTLLREEPLMAQELLLLHKEGEVVYTEVDINPMRWEGAPQYLAVVHDITVRKALEERQNEALFFTLLRDLTEKEEAARELRQRATTDPLTGAFNRAKFDERLAQELSRVQRHGNPLTLAILDIDKFKQVNDTFGHASGDQVLSQVSAVARNNLRSADLFARWGGEEFVVLAPDTDRDGGFRLAEKIRAAIERHPFDEVGRITASFGVAEYRAGESPEAFLRRADEALYQAKHGGRNRVVAA